MTEVNCSTEALVEAAAHAAYEANRAYCAAIGELSGLSWADAEKWRPWASALEDNWDQYRPVLGQELDRLRRRAQRGWSYEATGQREFRVPWSDEPRRQTVYTDVYRGPGKGTARHKKGW